MATRVRSGPAPPFPGQALPGWRSRRTGIRAALVGVLSLVGGEGVLGEAHSRAGVILGSPQPSSPRSGSWYSQTPFRMPAPTNATSWARSRTSLRSVRRAKARTTSRVGWGASSSSPSLVFTSRVERLRAGSECLVHAARRSRIASVWLGLEARLCDDVELDRLQARSRLGTYRTFTWLQTAMLRLSSSDS